jgi:EF-P beta-lysylation protein EpmB
MVPRLIGLVSFVAGWRLNLTRLMSNPQRRGPATGGQKMAIVTSTSDSVRTGHSGKPDSDMASWQQIIKGAIRDPDELRRRLGLPPLARSQAPGVDEAHRQFQTFVPAPYLSRIRPNDPDDPLLKQVLPAADETTAVPGFQTDAVGDLNATRNPGLIHKYEGRALLIASGACAVHCRYCFRRHFPYHSAPRSPAEFEPALQVVRDDPSIHEIILSGGDPLVLTDARFRALVRSIDAVDHVQRLRIHTRLPVVIPQRVTKGLQKTLRETRTTTLIVLHMNHPAEIDHAVECAVDRLLDTGITLLNQSVLLGGVNDDAATLIRLSERLVAMRCLPYYLHQLDRVKGAAHFEVPVETGQRLIETMRNALPGYAVPRYVTEIAGEPAKRVLA